MPRCPKVHERLDPSLLLFMPQNIQQAQHLAGSEISVTPNIWRFPTRILENHGGTIVSSRAMLHSAGRQGCWQEQASHLHIMLERPYADYYTYDID